MTPVVDENDRFQRLTKSINAAKRDREDDGIGTCLRAARWFPLSRDPFVNLSHVLQVGISKSLGVTIKALKAVDHTNDKDKEYHVKLYQDFIAMAPEFEGIIKCLKTDNGAVKDLLAKLSTAASDARSEDSARLKKAGLDYLARDPNKDVISPPLTKNDPKSNRGFNHPATARLLCPIKYLVQFNQDPEATMNALRNGSLKVTTGDWPSFMYEENDYDSGDMEKGLLRGYTVVRTCRHIFTAPSSALLTTTGRSKGSKKTKAELNGMTAITPSSIAYSVVQTFWWLCGAPQWQEVVGQVNLRKLFLNIVRLFEDDPEYKWCTETLTWWNEQVPGLRPSPSGVDPTMNNIKDATDNDDFDAILAARAKRRRVETTVTESTCTLGGRESKCEVAIIEDETVLPNRQCMLDEQDNKVEDVVIAKDEVVIAKDVVIVEDEAEVEVAIAKDEDAIVVDEAKDAAIAQDEVVIAKDTMIAEDVVIVEEEAKDIVIAQDEVVIAKDILTVIEDEARDVSHVDDNVAPVDSPVIAAEETLQCAVDDEDRESVLTDIDSPKIADAREDEPVDCVLSDTGGTKGKRGRKAGARGKISPQAELATTKDVSHTDPLLSEAGGTRAKRGRKSDGVLPEASETKAKRGRKAGASGRKKR